MDVHVSNAFVKDLEVKTAGGSFYTSHHLWLQASAMMQAKHCWNSAPRLQQCPKRLRGTPDALDLSMFALEPVACIDARLMRSPQPPVQSEDKAAMVHVAIYLLSESLLRELVTELAAVRGPMHPDAEAVVTLVSLDSLLPKAHRKCLVEAYVSVALARHMPPMLPPDLRDEAWQVFDGLDKSILVPPSALRPTSCKSSPGQPTLERFLRIGGLPTNLELLNNVVKNTWSVGFTYRDDPSGMLYAALRLFGILKRGLHGVHTATDVANKLAENSSNTTV